MTCQIDIFGPEPAPKPRTDTRWVSAYMSDCGTYRYTLARYWDAGPLAYWVLLNPSTADASQDDPTIRRCIGFSRREGFGGLVLLNLFALRSTDPAGLAAVDDAIGPENDRLLRKLFAEADSVICAWGAYPGAAQRAVDVRAAANAAGCRLLCLGQTQSGAPKHPLYLKSDTELSPWK